MSLNLKVAVERVRVGAHWVDPARRDDAAPPWAQGEATPLGGLGWAQSRPQRFHPLGEPIGSKNMKKIKCL